MNTIPGEDRVFLVWGKFPHTAQGSVELSTASGNHTLSTVRVTNTFAEFRISGDLLEASDLPATAKLFVNGSHYRTITLVNSEADSEPPVTSPGGGGSVVDNTKWFDANGVPDLEKIVEDIPGFTITNGNNPTVTDGLVGNPEPNQFTRVDRDFTFTGKTGLYTLQRSINTLGGATNFSSTFTCNSLAQAAPINHTIGGGATFNTVVEPFVLVNGTTYAVWVDADVADGAFVMNYSFTPLVL